MVFPSHRDPISRSRSLVRQTLPVGANQHKVCQAGLWKVKKPKRPCGVSFALSGPCEGDLTDVVKLGLKLAKEAIASGDAEYAKAILMRIPVIQKERAIAEHEEKLGRLMKQYQRLAG